MAVLAYMPSAPVGTSNGQDKRQAAEVNGQEQDALRPEVVI